MLVLFILLHYFHAQEWVLIFSMRLREMLHNLCQTIDPDLLEDYEPYEYADSVTVSNDVTVPQDCDLFYLDCDLGEFAAALYLDKGMFYAIYFFFQNIIKIAWIQDLIWTCLLTNVCTSISLQIIVKKLKLENHLLKISRLMMWIVLSTCVSKKFKIGTIMDTKIHSTTV